MRGLFLFDYGVRTFLKNMQKMIELNELSVKSLLLEMRFNGQTLSSGTGFVAKMGSEYYLVTNRHNVTGRHQETGALLSPTKGIPNQVAVLHNVEGKLGSWEWRVESLYENDEPSWYEHPSFGPKTDIVCLKLTDLNGVQLFAYDLFQDGPGFLIGPAETVSVIGFPFGLSGGGGLGIWATGFIATEPQVDFKDLPLFLIDCRSRPGQSGSPVVISKNGGAVAYQNGSVSVGSEPQNELLGIYSGRINTQSDLGMVWKVSAIRELVLNASEMKS